MKSRVVIKPPKLQAMVDIGLKQAEATPYVFYITSGGDIMMLSEVINCDIGDAYGYESVKAVISRRVGKDFKSENSRITYVSKFREDAIRKVILAGKTVYATDYMNEVFDIYAAVRNSED